MNIDTFNKLRWSRQAKVFDLEFNRSRAITRSPPASLGNHCAYFVFLAPVALVCITSDVRDIYFALPSDEAKFCLDETISLRKDKANERDWQFGDWELASAYIAAAEELKDVLYPPEPIPANAYCVGDDLDY